VRLTSVTALALASAFALPSAALADQTVQAIDGIASADDNKWSPSTLTVTVGETVTWKFDGTTLYHNVISSPSSPTPWSLTSPPTIAGPAVQHAFTAPGYYTFVCQLHPGPMVGTVEVRDATGQAPPPPPPPPLSEQPLPNDIGPLTGFERVDAVAPTLSRVSVSRISRGARVRFRLSEAGRATLAFKRAGKTVKTRTVDARKGANAVTVRGLRKGSYRVELRASDLSGNAAATKRASLRLR
jgi:plastocyanin